MFQRSGKFRRDCNVLRISPLCSWLLHVLTSCCTCSPCCRMVQEGVGGLDLPALTLH